MQHREESPRSPSPVRFSAFLRDLETALDFGMQELEASPSHVTGAVQTHKIGRMTLTSVSASSYAARGHRRLARNDLAAVLLVLRGSTHFTQPGVDLRLGAGQYCLLDLDTAWASVMSDDFHNILVRVPTSDLETAVPGWSRAIGTVLDGRTGLGSLFFGLIGGVVRSGIAMEPDAAAGVAAAAVDLLGSALLALPWGSPQAPTQMEQYHMARIREFVQQKLRDPALDVDMVAAHLGLSPRHVHRLFNKAPQHLMQWVLTERLRLCHDDLCRPHLRHRTIAHIAYAWGFNDPAHFSRAFRQRYGVAPSEVRQRACAK